ncbi:MAG: hypothetical protein HGB11_13330 [Chlorobiales bacterium]|nr:hypothetical protein [Chlorobiales bacterium]
MIFKKNLFIKQMEDFIGNKIVGRVKTVALEKAAVKLVQEIGIARQLERIENFPVGLGLLYEGIKHLAHAAIQTGTVSSGNSSFHRNALSFLALAAPKRRNRFFLYSRYIFVIQSNAVAKAFRRQFTSMWEKATPLSAPTPAKGR